MNPSLLSAAFQQEASQREALSAGQRSFFSAETSSGPSLSVLGPCGHPSQDPTSATGGLPSVSSQSLHPRILPVVSQSRGLLPPRESSQVDQSTLLQLQQMLGNAAAPLPPYALPSTLMRDILLGGSSRQVAHPMSFDPSAFSFGGGMPPPLVSTVARPSVNAVVEDLMAAQLMRLVPAPVPAPASYSHALFNNQVLSTLDASLGEYALREALGTAPGQPFQLPSAAFSLSPHLSPSNEQSATSATATRKASSSQTRDPVSMFCRSDEHVLSEYQCLLRQQMEFFEASPEDVASNAQGRNKPIQLRQVSRALQGYPEVSC